MHEMRGNIFGPVRVSALYFVTPQNLCVLGGSNVLPTFEPGPFLWLRSPEQAIERVKERVRQGGHHIPEETIIRRYYSGIKNLLLHYFPLADTAIIFDNSSDQSNLRMIARKNDDKSVEIIDPSLWNTLEGKKA